MMRDIQRFLKDYGFILGPASLAALAAFAIRKIVWLARWDAVTIGLLAAGILLGALFILGNPEQVQSVLTKRGTRYGFNAAVMSIAFIAILGGLNYLVIQFLDQRIDVTELKRHTLSPQSKQVLAEVNREVNIIGFFTADEYALQEDFKEMLDQYLAESNYLTYIVIDPDQDPVGARIQGEPPYQGLLFKSGTHTARVQYSPSEQEITNALLKVTSDKQKVIYFLQGHAERDIASGAEDGYSVVAEKLRAQNYKVKTLNLVISDTVPSDAAAIVIASPQGKLLDEELTRLQTYLNSGGRALIMQDPYFEAGLNIVLSNWQVRFGDGFVVDEVNRAQSSPVVPVGVNYGYSPITSDLERQHMYTFFFLARPIEQTGDPPAGVTFTALVKTSEHSWAETGTEISQDDADTAGPLNLVATIESNPLFSSGSATSSSKTRIVLIGDTEFAINDIVNQAIGNELLFLNAVNWLAEEERLIAIGPKDAGPSYIVITDRDRNVIVFLSIFVIPLMIGATGIVVWLMRRIRSKFQV